MRRSRLALLLAALGGLFAAVAVTGVAGVSERLLERLGREQALARAALAGSAAREALEHEGDALAIGARLLAASPELGAHLSVHDLHGVTRLLEGFRRAGDASGAALVLDGRLVSPGTPPLPWPALRGALPTEAPWGFFSVGDALYLVAEAPMADRGARVRLARAIDPPLLSAISGRIGLPVQLVSRREALAGYGESHAARLARVVAERRPEILRSTEAGCFCALEPLPVATGEVGAVLETRLPLAEVEGSVAELRRRLLVLAAGLALLGAFAAALLARRLALPLVDLSDAARRIGSGDLDTPVAVSGPAEIGTLAGEMEGMRRQLAHLSDRLRAREGEARAVLAGISDGVLTVDRDRKVRYLNRPAAIALGLDPDRGRELARGRFCGDLLHPALAADRRPCEERCPILHARFRGSAQAVESLALPSAARPVVVAAAPPVGEVQVVVLRGETEVEAGRRLRDALLANVSHEFKTPLAAQTASLEMLHERLSAGDLAGAETLAAALGRGTARLTRLVDNLLESLGIEAGRDAIRRHPVELDLVVEEAVQQMAPLLLQRRQELAIELPASLPVLPGDAPRLVQVLVNLLANANKFAPEGSPILLGGEVTPEAVALFVEDRGPGLRGADAESLFQPFVRSGGEEPEASGVGLGLWVVRSIVERHGGRVEALDTGTGARFTVRLPRAGDRLPTASPS